MDSESRQGGISMHAADLQGSRAGSISSATGRPPLPRVEEMADRALAAFIIIQVDILSCKTDVCMSKPMPCRDCQPHLRAHACRRCSRCRRG